MKIVRVTEVLSIIKDGLDDLRERMGDEACDEMLKAKADISKRLHAATANYDMDGVEDSGDDEVQPYLNHYIAWHKSAVVHVTSAEHRIENAKLGITGQPDKVLRICGDDLDSVVDIKMTAGRSFKWEMQLGGYNCLLPQGTIGRHIVLWFRKTKKKKGIDYKMDVVDLGDTIRNQNLFLGILSAYRWKEAHE